MKKVIYSIFAILVVVVAGFIYFSVNKGSDSSDNQKPKTETIVNVKSLEKVNELVLLNASIQKVKSIENNTKLFGSNFVIPGSEKKALIILNYTAKFGIKNDVTIKDNGNHNYQVTLPKFEVIGVELDKDKPYTLYDTSGGILSYSTKDIDTGEAVAEGFSNKEQQGFIKDNKKLLKESAEKYYSTMIKSLDHEAKVTIETQK